MSEQNYSPNQNGGIDVRRIIREKPITSLALVAVFSLVVGLGLVLQSDQMLTSSSRAASSSNGPQCPAGTMPLFNKTGNFESSNMYPGTTVLATKGNWKIATRKGVIVAEAGSGNATVNLAFASPITIDKVLIYDNDHNPAWTLNGYTLPKTANNQWFPAPYDFPNKAPTTSLIFNSNGDSPHFNVCIPGNPPNLTITPTSTPLPSVTPTKPPGVTVTPTKPVSPTPSTIACTSMNGQITVDKYGATKLSLTVHPNIPLPGYYVRIMKDGSIVSQSTMQTFALYTATISNPTTGKYVAYVSRSSSLGFVTSPQCEYTNAVAATPSPTVTQPPQAILPQCISASPTEPIPYGGGSVNVSVTALNSNYVRFLEIGKNNSYVLLGTFPYTGTSANNYRLNLKTAQAYRVESLRLENGTWLTGSFCRFEGAPAGMSPTGEPLPSSTF